MPRVSRRDFLTGLGVTLAGAALPPRMPLPPEEMTRPDPPPAPLGRIATWHLQAVRLEATASAEVVAWKRHDDIIPLFASAVGEAPWPSNPIWYKTTGGWIHSGYVQPVERRPNREIIERVVAPGFWTG